MSHPLRKGLELARAQLKKDGHNDLQAYVDAVLAPRGWMALKSSDPSGRTVPLSLTITKGLRDALKQAATEFDVVLASLAEEGFRAVLETDWLPSEMQKHSRKGNPEYAKAVLQLQVDTDLRDRVQEALPELTGRAGYSVTLSSVAISWMTDQLGVQRPGESTQPLMLQLIPTAWCDHWETVAAEQGVTLQSVLEDGIRDLRDGVWEMPRPVRAAKGSSVRVTADNQVRRFRIRINTELREFLDEQAPLLAAQHDRRVFPGTIGLAILKDRLGLPAGE